MTEDHEHDDDRAGAARRTVIERSSTRLTSWWPVVAPAAALVAGLLIGGVVVGVARGGDAGSAVRERSPSQSTPGATTSPSRGPTTVVVPSQCLEAADTVDRLTSLTREAVGAIRDFEPQQLRQMLDRLETLDADARKQAAACRDVKVRGSSDQ